MSPAYAFEQSCFKKLWQLSPENTPGFLRLLGCPDKQLGSDLGDEDPTDTDPGLALPPPSSSFSCALAPFTSCVTARALTLQEGITTCNFHQETGASRLWLGRPVG